MPISNFENDLQDFYEAHRRKHLTAQLDQAAALMRETLLLSALHRGLFEEPNTPDADVRDTVGDLRQRVAANEFDRVETELEPTLTQLREELETVRSRFLTERHDLAERVNGFRSLNDRIDRLDPEQIDTLLRDLQTVDNSLTDFEGDFDDQLTEAERTGEQLAERIRIIEDELFEPFRGSDIEGVVRDLIDGEQLILTDCDPETYTALQESELGSYVNLALEGEG